MKKEKALEIIQKEIDRWTTAKKVMEKLEPKKKYRIKFKIVSWDYSAGGWKNRVLIEKESEFIGTLKVYNKESINFEVLTVSDIEKSPFDYKLRQRGREDQHRLRDIERLEQELDRSPSEERIKEIKKTIKTREAANRKPFHAAIKLTDFISVEEWEPSAAEAPLMVNNDFISVKMRKELFGV